MAASLRSTAALFSLLFMSFGFSLLSAAYASAAGLNLSWSFCGTAGTFNMSDPCDQNTLLTSWHLFGSAVSPQAIPTGTPLFTGHRSWVYFQNANPTLDDWWKMAPGDCRAGQYAIAHTSSTMGGGAPCVKTIMGSAPITSMNGWTDNSGPNPVNTARLEMIAARSDAGGTVSSNSQYMMFDLTILGAGAAADPNDPSAPVCAGCADAACIVYRQAELNRADGSAIIVTGPFQRQAVTWQGGVVPGVDCLSTPTRKSTWGQLKSLYR
jgi:hypothetical protein